MVLLGLLVAAGLAALGLVAAASGLWSRGFTPGAMAAAAPVFRDVVGDLGGMPVRIPRHIPELLEYDGDPGWAPRPGWRPPERTHASRIASFGFELRYPKRNELDYMQGDAVPDYQGTCALTSIANLMTQSGRPTTESQVVQLAIQNNWAVNNPALPAHQLGGSNVHDQQAILESYNLRSDVIDGYNEVGVAQLLRSGRGVIMAVNAGRLWGEAAYTGDGTVNHAVTLTGAVYGADDGQLKGFYITDSGRGRVDDMTRFVDVATFRSAAQVPGAYAIYTLEPVKFWDEDMAGSGNGLDNQLQGNRGNNWLAGMAGNDVLAGGEGNDTLIGDAGNDRYLFARGDGQDHVDQTGSLVTDYDVIEFAPGIASDQLWFRQVGLSLEISVAGTSDSLTVSGWFGSADQQVDAIKAGDGRWLQRDQVDALVQAMAEFAPPASGQMQLQAGAYPDLAPVLAASWA